ncbi:MAG: NFACT family protein [Thermoplasmata archaeon]|nr:NFACT family protein [Thermoplasmata archaeon]
MKTQMSNFDVAAFVRESQAYVGMQVEKVFQMSYSEVWLRLSAKGKKATLVIKLGRAMWFEDEYLKSDVEPPNFAMLLRKNLGRKKLNSITQHGFDRIVVLTFGAEMNIKIVVELFGKGNMILIEGDKIIKPLTSKSWRHRDVKPGVEFKFPPEGVNPLDLDREDISEILEGSSKDIVRTMAAQLNLGGSYAEEICEFLSIPKDTKANELDEAAHEMIWEALVSIIAGLDDIKPILKYREEEDLDLLPHPLCDHGEDESITFETFNQALREYFTSLPDEIKEEEKEYVSPEAQRLERQVEHQNDAIELHEREIVEYQEFGDLVYAEYAKYEQILAKTSEMLDSMGWAGSKAELEKWDKIISFDPAKGLLELSLDEDLSIVLDVRKNVNDNAGIQYYRSKRARQKLDGAREALGETLTLLGKAQKEDVKKTEARKMQPTRQMWFDRYRWFQSSEGFLVVGGRDARSNDKVVKKHLKDDGMYAHADIQGAPSIIIMKGKDAGEKTMLEACEFGLCNSKAWKAKLASGSSYWVKPSQVSKTAQPGEFLARGAFVIRGKRNYHDKLEMKLAIGEVLYEGERKIMCAPVDAILAHTPEMFVIVPGDTNANKFAKKVAAFYNVPIEEISRITPPGDVEIIKEPAPRDVSDE